MAALAAAVEHMADHVLRELELHRTRPRTEDEQIPPLFVAVQGPQGSGKTYCTGQLRARLAPLTVAVISVDDLYLPHDALVVLARAHPDNALLAGRGQPGTHDIELGSHLLRTLRCINSPAAENAIVPVFDKSLHGGEGDRLQEGIAVHPPLDVVLLEGWFIGFCPVSRAEIERRYEQPVASLTEDFFSLKTYRKADIEDVNNRLEAYLEWWSYFDALIQIAPVKSHPYAYIYKWRLEQEHYMKAKNGGKGMSDEQVKSFIDRYIPGYVFFGDGVLTGRARTDGGFDPPRWTGHGLKIVIGETRGVVETKRF